MKIDVVALNPSIQALNDGSAAIVFVVIRIPPYGPRSARGYADGPEETHREILEDKDMP